MLDKPLRSHNNWDRGRSLVKYQFDCVMGACKSFRVLCDG